MTGLGSIAEIGATAARLAEAFRNWMMAELDIETLREIDRRNFRFNLSPTRSTGCCATHDFCDANIGMADAFIDVLAREPDIDSIPDCELWGWAWDEAMRRGFSGEDLRSLFEVPPP